jgi:hypothetical protein
VDRAALAGRINQNQLRVDVHASVYIVTGILILEALSIVLHRGTRPPHVSTSQRR